MRVISGSLKGRVIKAPKKLPVRPTTDKAKEGLFNILMNRLEMKELAVLDLFAGTGNMTFEFLSRGAVSTTSVDKNFHCVAFINTVLQDWKLSNGKALRTDAMKFISAPSGRYDLIFADPPYDFDHYPELVTRILENSLLNPEGLLIVEHPSSVSFEEVPQFQFVRNYGKVHFSFFSEP